MLTFTTKPGKSFAWVVEGKGKKAIRENASQAIRWALADYVRMRQPDRFKKSAFATYGFALRSKGYIKKQMRAVNTAGMVPFVSPRISVEWAMQMLAKVAREQAGGPVSGAVIKLAATANEALRRAGTPHMRDLIRVPGSGYSIIGKNRNAKLIQPGARILNRHKKYANEFRNLHRGGDARWIMMRAEHHFNRLMKATAKPGKAG